MSAPLSFQHEMLLANAGSGKTYALTSRIIRLLLAGVSIDRIAALTFTRKSAGEFLDELLLRLADAASNSEKCAQLAASANRPELSAEDCCQLLAHIIEHFGCLGLGTIDSFFARIARQFPLESGLPEDFAIADTASLASARDRALAAAFARGTQDAASLEAMIEQCRQISRRNGERDVFGTLLHQVESLHQDYLDTPPGCTWGDANAIWKGKPPFADDIDLPQVIDAFEQIIHATAPELPDPAIANLEAGLAELRALEPGQAWSKDLQKFITQKLSSEPKSGHIQFDRKKTGWVELTAEVRAARARLVEALFGDALRQVLARAQGLYQFIGHYESVYAELVRDAGLVSFSDINAMLAERASDTGDLEALDWRTQVAYRIDQYFDHWLLDEFQDTSRSQWRILRTFLDEVLMDDAAQRSFFYVGDTKQAIYSWRGGDPTLFNEIFHHYSPAIEEAAPLTESWRSTKPIIEMVNTVFENVEAIQHELTLKDEALQGWQTGWNTHLVAEPLQEKVGFATWRALEKDPDDEASAQHMEVRRILEEVRPTEHDIECAVLLRKNNEAAELAAYLQTAGIPVAVEGKSNPCTDNPLGSAVLAALRAVAHPADSYAATIAAGYPCASAWGMSDLKHFRTQTLQRIAEEGYAITIQNWVELAELGTHTLIRPQHIKQESTTDREQSSQAKQTESFLTTRGEALLAAAETYDARNNSGEGIDGFIAFVESLEMQEAEATNAVRIMTVHQAKGLGFEMVITCGLDGRSGGGSTDELVLGPDPRTPEWGLILPRKDIAKADPLLNALVEKEAAESQLSELCNAYVALTRAKRALYVLSNSLGEKSKAKNFGRHLQLTLEENWSAGDPQWHKVAGASISPAPPPTSSAS